MKKEQLAALIGRPLTEVEVTNFDLYLQIAIEKLETLLCSSLSCDGDDRTYVARPGYSTIWTDVVTSIDRITVDGDPVAQDRYQLMQNGKYNGSWYNNIVFNTAFHEPSVIVVEADWGFDKKPADLKLLIARAFDLTSKENNLDRQINSKKIEDFTVTYNHSSITMTDTLAESFAKDNQSTIAKYSICGVGDISSGAICRGRYEIRDGVAYVGI